MSQKAKSRREADRLCRRRVALPDLLPMLVVGLALLALHPPRWVVAAEKQAPGPATPQSKAQEPKPAGKKPAGKKPRKEPRKEDPAKAKARADSLAKILSHLGVGEGSVVADVGAGNGPDTWTFAKIVGQTGTVFAEEIAEGKVESLKKQAQEKGLPQVRAVLGRDDDPCLPPNSADFAFLHRVYHHFTKPRQMLRGIWRSLKPGGYLVVVDQRRGTLRDWVPRHERGGKHFWIAETTVVREAREAGFAFVGFGEEHWHEKDPFVLIFRRPKAPQAPDRDPDPFLPLPVDQCCHLFVPLGSPYERPVFVALGEARGLIAPILEHSSGEGLEIVLEEWATQKDERPPLPPNVAFPSVLTDQGDPHLESEPIDVVFFLDTYHLLFHGKTLLAKLHERLSPTGCIYVLDREANGPLPRREASHRRKIAVKTVEEEMAQAGFSLWFRGPRPAADRFLLVFGKAQPEKTPPENDPFVGGPEIPASPSTWVKENCWRLRGMKTADGRYVALTGLEERRSIKAVPATSPDTEIWIVPNQRLVLSFVKKGERYLLEDYRPLPAPK